MAQDTEQLRRIMENLKCSETEAAEIMAYDKAVDRGEKTPHDLTPAQNKVAQSYARTGTRKPTVYKFEKKERKPNEPKRELIQTITDALIEQGMIDDNSLHIENIERQIDFTFNGVKYRIVLSAPRK
jgi:hypothetical protein